MFSFFYLWLYYFREQVFRQISYSYTFQAIEKDPNNIDLLLERALYNKERDNFESALFDLNQCIVLDSLNANYQFSVADIYFKLSKLPNANSKYPGLSKHHLAKH